MDDLLSKQRQTWETGSISSDAGGTPLDENLRRVAHFFNPSETDPVLIERFLAEVDLSFLHDELLAYYKDPKRIIYPPEIVLKTIVDMVLRKYTSPEQIIEFLRANPETAKALGYKRRSDGSVTIPTGQRVQITPPDGYELPCGQLLRHALFYRFGIEGFLMIYDRTARAVIDEATRWGLDLCAEVTGDGRALEAVPSDQEAQYNGHYEMKGWKGVTLLTTREHLPIATTTIRLNDAEWPVMVHLVQQAQARGCHMVRITLDGAYEPFECLALLEGAMGVEVVTKPQKDWVTHPEATEEELQRRYQTYHDELWFTMGASLDEIRRLLTIHGSTGDRAMVGMEIRNRLMARREADPEGFDAEYHPRSNAESYNNSEKHDYGCRQWLHRRPGQWWALSARTIVCLSMLVVALTRLQHGVTQGLMSVVGMA